MTTSRQDKNLGPNASLIGVAGSRHRLSTPALVLDLDLFERNLEAMADHCDRKKISLRPHAKTHKCAEIAKRQIDNGAVGVCCAKLGEAEALGQEGIESILITSPVVTKSGIARLCNLNVQISDLMVVVDNLAVAVAIAAEAEHRAKPMKIIIDLDVGLHRTGTRLGSGVEDIAGLAANTEYLDLKGVQAYAGHIQHIADFEERSAEAQKALDIVKLTCKTLADRGQAPEIVTGGGTGTYNIDTEDGIMTELQAGSYAFMDRQYNEVPIANAAPMPFDTSLTVQTTIVSANTPGLATADAGFKSFASDADAPILQSGAPEGSAYFFFGDEHGGIALPDTDTKLPVGSVLECVTPHCDPTVNLYDHFHCVRGDTLVDIWPIDARGRSQ